MARQILLLALGLLLGAVLGLFLPVPVFLALDLFFGVRTGSYEDVLPWMLLSTPLCALGGGALGFRLGRWMRERRLRRLREGL